MNSKPKILQIDPDSLPKSCLGPDGKIKIENEAERRRRLEEARAVLKRIAEIPNEPGDPPDEVWMRNMDESRPDRPPFNGCYD